MRGVVPYQFTGGGMWAKEAQRHWVQLGRKPFAALLGGARVDIARDLDVDLRLLDQCLPQERADFVPFEEAVGVLVADRAAAVDGLGYSLRTDAITGRAAIAGIERVAPH